MSEVRILLRWFLLVIVLVALTFCTASSSSSGGTLLRNPCGTGVGTTESSAPIVCVDDSGATLSVNPDPVTAHGKVNKVPVMIHWWTRSGGGTLGIDVRPGCVTDVSCSGAHCTARTIPTPGGARCKYDVWTDTKPRLDPDIVITDCCAP